MHVAIIGAGTLGTVYGVHLAHAGACVSFVVRSNHETPSRPALIENVSSRRQLSLPAPDKTTHVLPNTEVVLLCVRAENLNDVLDAHANASPAVPWISLTPLLPAALIRARDATRGRLVAAMPGVAAYQPEGSSVIRYWTPRWTPTLLDQSFATNAAVLRWVSLARTSGIPAQFASNVDKLNPATTITFLPLVLLLDLSGGTVQQALASGMLDIASKAVRECRSIANTIGQVPAWAATAANLMRPASLRATIAMATMTYPEAIRFVERHFGRKTHVQNLGLAQDVIALGMQHHLDVTNLRALVNHRER